MDFIRGNLFDRSDMRLLPSNLPGPDNDLSDRIEHYVTRAIQEMDARSLMHLGSGGGRRAEKQTRFLASGRETGFTTFI